MHTSSSTTEKPATESSELLQEQLAHAPEGSILALIKRMETNAPPHSPTPERVPDLEKAIENTVPAEVAIALETRKATVGRKKTLPKDAKRSEGETSSLTENSQRAPIKVGKTKQAMQPLGRGFKIKKTVTAKTLAANRKNAKRSTGPRTRRGKENSKFNAIAHGLFSQNVAIPACDGEDAASNYALLLDDVRKGWKPVGFHEEWLVEELAKIKWRFRRATFAEFGYGRRHLTFYPPHLNRDYVSLVQQRDDFRNNLKLLRLADHELRSRGGLVRNNTRKRSGLAYTSGSDWSRRYASDRPH